VGEIRCGDRPSWEVTPGRHSVRVSGVECVVDIVAGQFVEVKALPKSGRLSGAGQHTFVRPAVEVDRWGPIKVD